MIPYLKADFWRINRRLPRIFVFLIYLVIGIAMTLSSTNQKNFNFIKLGDSMASTLLFLPVFLAVFNLYFVFEDDLQTKTMQVAIGRGTKKLQVIFIKWIEMFLLTFFDCAVLLLCMCGVGLTKGIRLKGSAISQVLAQFCGSWLTIGAMTALIMVIIFHILQIGLTQILFLVLIFKPFTIILSYLETSKEFMARLHLSRFLLGNALNQFQFSMEAGRFDPGNFIIIFIYWMIGIGATYLLFRKKELDF